MGRKRLTPLARRLRANQTEAEERLCYYLRSRRLDGGQHSAERDAARTAIIETYGYRVLRFWNHDALENTQGVLEAIRHEFLIARNRPE